MVGAMGSRIITISLTSSAECQLAGYPSVEALDPSGRTLEVPTYQDTGLANYNGPTAVGASTPAVLTLEWSYQWCAAPVNIAKLRVTLPANGGSFTVTGFGPSACVNSPTPSYREPIGIGPIQPRDYQLPHPTTEFNDATVSLVVPHVAVSPGDTLRFSVSLHAPALRDIPLNPCPDYTIWLKGYSEAMESYALNCRAVPHRDAAGNPLLPAGSVVVFAMQVTLPFADGPSSGTTLFLGWHLNTEEQTGGNVLLTLA
jgi:hypothetical protein